MMLTAYRRMAPLVSKEFLNPSQAVKHIADLIHSLFENSNIDSDCGEGAAKVEIEITCGSKEPRSDRTLQNPWNNLLPSIALD